MAAPAPPPVPSRWKLALVQVGFLGLLVFAWNRGRPESLHEPAETVTGSGAEPGAGGGLRFREVAHELGIDFEHRPTKVHPSVAGIAPQITAVGAAVSVADPDGDGWPDLYAVTSAHGEPNALFHNRGDGTFEEIAAAAGLADLNREGQGCSMGSVWADYDGDGRQDVLVYEWGQSQLFHNEGGLRFRETTKEAGLEAWVNSNAATWIDYDRDGYLDLYLTGYFSEEHDLWNLDTTRIMHDSFEFATNGGRNRLYHNRGDGTFEEVTKESGADSTRWTYAVVAADFDRDGWQDLYLANDYGTEELLLNHEGRRFEAATGIDVESESKSGMCVALGDVWGDGRLCVYVTNISRSGYLFQGNNLRVSFVDEGGPMLQIAEGPVTDCGWAWGAQFGDLDSDGFQDLVVVNGFISASRDRDYWYQMSKIGLASGSVVADAAKWPPFEDRSLSGYERTRVLQNLGGRGHFREVGRQVGIDDVYDGRAVVLADLDRDGRLDVVVANQAGPLLVYRNEGSRSNHWIGFDLRGATANREAVGASVTVETGERSQIRVVTTASGFAGQNDHVAHFGLGADAKPVRAVVRWPSGEESRLEGLEPDRVHVVREGEERP